MKRLIFILCFMIAGSLNAATVTRYVNTGSSGGDGTTSALSGATAAYASLSAWESAEDGVDHSGDDMVVNCAGTAADTTQVIIDASWTADSITINGDNDTGEWDTSKYRLDVENTAFAALDILEQYVTINDLQVSNSYTGETTSYSCIRALTVSGAGEININNTIMLAVKVHAFQLQGNMDGNVILTNCILIKDGTDTSGEGTGQSVAGFDVFAIFRNCTAYGFNVGFARGNGNSPVATNCIATDCTDNYAAITTTYCASSAASELSGTGDITTACTAANNFTDASSGDFSVKDTDADIYNAGTTISGVTTDITGTTRSTSDIGAFELITETSKLIMVY